MTDKIKAKIKTTKAKLNKVLAEWFKVRDGLDKKVTAIYENYRHGSRKFYASLEAHNRKATKIYWKWNLLVARAERNAEKAREEANRELV